MSSDDVEPTDAPARQEHGPTDAPARQEHWPTDAPPRQEHEPEIEVWAAGVLLGRNGAEGPEILVIHRPDRRDWSLPKGKVDPGETLAETARRELFEETGYECELGPSIASVRYEDARGRSKQVVYFEGRVTGGDFEPNNEVDEILWCRPLDAVALLTYPHDRRLVMDRVGPG